MQGGPAPSGRALVISLAAVGRDMPGPGIRAVELARTLSKHTAVTLATHDHDGTDVGVDCVTFNRHDGRSLRPHLDGVELVFGQPQWPLVMRELRRSGARLVFDLYAPDPVELLQHLDSAQPRKRAVLATLALDRFADALRSGHHFVCASEAQRDLWLGTALGERMLGPRAYDRISDPASVISLLPFGLPTEAPSGGGGIRREFPEIGDEDEIILWNGGLWNWLDPETAIRAVAELARRRPGIRLVFMGAAGGRAAAGPAEVARELASDLGLLGSSVHFCERWVGYRERADWLLDADCAVSCHVGSLATRFAFLSRLLDCFWAGLPVVCTAGDSLATEIEGQDLGAVVPERDPEALAGALEQVLERGRPAFAEALGKAAERYRWSRLAAPLIEQLQAAPGPPPFSGSMPRLSERLRTSAYRCARAPLNLAGVRGWPGR